MTSEHKKMAEADDTMVAMESRDNHDVAESRVNYADMVDTLGGASNSFNTLGYRNTMLGQNRLGQSMARPQGNSITQHTVSNVAGAAGTGLSNLDYDYNISETPNRRFSSPGVSGYGNVGLTGAGGYGTTGLTRNGYGGGGSGYGSGYGYTPVSYGTDYATTCEDKGLNPALVLATLAGAAVAFALIYRQVTIGRSLKSGPPTPKQLLDYLADAVWSGLEDFEEKIDRIAENNNGDENSWISKLYNQFSGEFNDIDDSLTEGDLDGLEPPILDETWGLGIRTKQNKTGSTVVEEPVPLDSSRKRRTAEAEENTAENVVEAEDEEACRVEMWRCLSAVIEHGLHYMDKPEGLMGFAKKTMFKVAFHGGLSNAWSGLMSVPEARQVQKCMSTHQECVAYEVLRREAKNSLDPSDPDYNLYTKNMNSKDKSAFKTHVENKKARLLVNPEFVENLDHSDGSTQYDEIIED